MTLIVEREKGQFPLSIGTSLAFEALVGINPNIQYKKLPVKEYSVLWVNVKTIFRNIYQSIDTEVRDKVTLNQYLMLLRDELLYIKEWCDSYGEDMKLHLYCPEYSGLRSMYRYAELREDKPNRTVKQMQYTNLINQVFYQFIKKTTYVNDLNIDVFKNKIPKADYLKTLILTSYAYDLINPYLFSKLDLIESHTGKIKPRTQWNSKYHNGVKLYMMPFNVDLLQIFGDKELFAPLSPKITRAVIEMAKKDKWTPLTTKDRIKYSISKLLDPSLRELLKLIVH
jgi:hypothetical protein